MTTNNYSRYLGLALVSLAAGASAYGQVVTYTGAISGSLGDTGVISISIDTAKFSTYFGGPGAAFGTPVSVPAADLATAGVSPAAYVFTYGHGTAGLTAFQAAPSAFNNLLVSFVNAGMNIQYVQYIQPGAFGGPDSFQATAIGGGTTTFSTGVGGDYTHFSGSPTGFPTETYTISTLLTPVPEPAAFAGIAGLALVGFGAYRRATRK